MDPMELRALRAEVGLAKGLTASQSRRLVGNSQQELEADADQLRTELNLGAGGGGQQQGGQQQVPSFDQGRQGGTVSQPAGSAGRAEAVKRYGAEAVARGSQARGSDRPLPSTAIPQG